MLPVRKPIEHVARAAVAVVPRGVREPDDPMLRVELDHARKALGHVGKRTRHRFGWLSNDVGDRVRACLLQAWNAVALRPEQKRLHDRVLKQVAPAVLVGHLDDLLIVPKSAVDRVPGHVSVLSFSKALSCVATFLLLDLAAFEDEAVVLPRVFAKRSPQHLDLRKPLLGRNEAQQVVVLGVHADGRDEGLGFHRSDRSTPIAGAP